MPISASVKTSSSLATHLVIWQSLVWSFFLADSLLLLLIVPGEIGAAQLRAWLPAGSTRTALLQILPALDASWITLAAINTYLFLVATEGLATARRWTLLILTLSGSLAWANARTGFPFGPLVFTDNLGLRLAHVLPFTLPLLWLVLLVNGRSVLLFLWPRAHPLTLAAGSGLLATLIDLNLEPVAWKMRAWWLWYPLARDAPAWPPLRNSLAWFTLAFILTGLLRGDRMIAARPSFPLRPFLILALLNGVCLAAHLTRLLRQIW